MTEMNNQIRIGIVYIAIGVYDEFWKEFYPTCECFFCSDAQKGYEVFTDSLRLQNMKFKNVTWHPVENKGFIRNVSAKSEFICNISDMLRQKYDYIFYMNGNYKFLEPILSDEVLPSAENDFLTALSFDMYKDTPVEKLAYDRNPDCHACMESGSGTRYYQGGFYGGRTEEVLKLSEWCMKHIQDDLDKKIIALWHDESYLNKYLSNYQPYTLNEIYGYADCTHYSQSYKAVLLDKDVYLGGKLSGFKQLSIDNSLSFLLNDELEPRKIGIVRFAGGLGNQMFQYAFYLYLRKRLGKQMDIYIDTCGCEQLINTFGMVKSAVLSEDLKKQIAQANMMQKLYIAEERISCVQDFPVPSTAITIYSGYWQCADYVEGGRTEIEKVFSFDKKRMNEESSLLLNQIESTCSVSIHIRRGDYMTPQNKEVYGRICTMDYYRKAMRKMKELLVGEPIFYLFSDDVEWVEKHFKYKNCVFVKGNCGMDDWQDIALMSACKHHILANSSFSWWGAWLGCNDGEQVIAPDWWYYGMPTPDLLPDSWIRVSVSKPDFKGWLSAHLILGELKIDTRSPYLQELALAIYYFLLAGSTHKSIYRKIAEAKLDYVCNHLGSIGIGSEFINVCQGIVYLYNEGYIVGNPDSIFEEIDHTLQEILKTMGENCLYLNLPSIAGYFISRITASGKRNRPIKLGLTKALEQAMHMVWAYRKVFSNEDKRHLLFLIREISKMEILSSDYTPLYMYCMNDCDITNLFFSEIEIGKLLLNK